MQNKRLKLKFKKKKREKASDDQHIESDKAKFNFHFDIKPIRTPTCYQTPIISNNLAGHLHMRDELL